MLTSADPNLNPSMRTKHGETSPLSPAIIFIRNWLKQKAMKPADRQARLRDIAKTLRRARETISEAMQSDVGNDLISAWWDADATRANALAVW